MDGGGNGDTGAAGLQELEYGHLARDVLVSHPVRAEHQVALPRLQFLAGRIVQVGKQDLVRQSQWLAQPLADDRQVALHG